MGLILTAIIAVGVLISVFLYFYSYGQGFFAPKREVGEFAVVLGKVESASREPYSIKITLNIFEVVRGSRFQRGDVIEIRFSGIGEAQIGGPIPWKKEISYNVKSDS